MSAIFVPVSWGEAIDKLTILSIKSERITDQAKLAFVNAERSALKSNLETLITPEQKEAFDAFESELKNINQTLWDIEDDIRVCEKKQDFGGEFIQLARWVYQTNDKRALIKSRVNDFFGSDFKEVKSYK